MTTDPWESLRAKLDEFHQWPSPYTFKFICPRAEFGRLQTSLDFPLQQTRESRGGKYVSVTVEVIMNSADEVIEVYQRTNDIPGLISL